MRQLKLVEDFGELREGMRVWLMACGWCRKNHSMKLMELEAGCNVPYPDGSKITTPSFRTDAGCDRLTTMYLSERAVRQHRVFRIVDVADPGAEERTGRSRTKERSR